MQLIDALRLTQNSVVAFVGAGGKTTALFRTARELVSGVKPDITRGTVLVTTTTHLGSWQAGLADRLIRINSLSDIKMFENNQPDGIALLIGGEENDRFSGLPPRILKEIYNIAEDKQLPLLIEADGAASCPLKAPAKHEPAVPEFCPKVVVVAGLSGLGMPLTRISVHRPEIFSDISGLKPGDFINPEALIKVLSSKNGGLKNIPPTARKVLLLNQADDEAAQSFGRSIAEQLKSVYDSIIIVSLSKGNKSEPQIIGDIKNRQIKIFAVIGQIGGIVLAAGGSSRYGEAKQKLLWKGQPIIRHVVLTAMKAGLYPLIVVVGAYGSEVERVISDLPVRIVTNRDWMDGVSTSIRMGINAISKDVDGVVFMQADQPQISHELILKLVDAHQESLSPITAPLINGIKSSPVLFDAKTFPDLLNLEGDSGGKALFSYYPVQSVIYNDLNQLLDIDTPEDYIKFLTIYPDEND